MQKKDTADWHLVCGGGHMDYYRKIFLKIDYDFGQMKNCLLTKYFDVIS